MPQTVPRTGTPQRTRPRWWAELPLIAVVYAAYSAGRLLARGSVSSAVGHGLGILEFEQKLRIDFETPLNDLFTQHASLGIPADFAYASLHYVVTPAIMVWLWKRRPAKYRLMRTWLLLSTLIGLIGFVTLPTCPPRLLDASHGFVDTMAQYGSYGWWGGEASAPRGLGGLTNQYAAMPSLHVGWSLWCGIALWRNGRSAWVKAAGIAYPLLTTLIVMGTANHYFLDAVAGAAVMGVGFLLAKPALRVSDRAWSRFAQRSPDGATEAPASDETGAKAGATATIAAQTTGAAGAAAGRDAPGNTPGAVGSGAKAAYGAAGAKDTAKARTVAADPADPTKAADTANAINAINAIDTAKTINASNVINALNTANTVNTVKTANAANAAEVGARAAVAGASADRSTPESGVTVSIVSGECETSAGEHIPQQSKRNADRDATAPADGAAAAAR
ncbi:hypothetical protein FHS42_002168 [Streptomyces zagrosensis]|uniref:Inositolphosphotransferase Aur1/Ipt1 domain-containing protein n=1 Tax=Streptomyces zagrosensis TaxID=1042984 RepID=A0A7W9UXP1_9ACTN|nr:hypothetical protein [Streptomyces zagrosensis]